MIKPIETTHTIRDVVSDAYTSMKRAPKALALGTALSLSPLAYGCSADKALGPIDDCKGGEECPVPQPWLFYDICVDERIEFKLGGAAMGVDSMKIQEISDNTCEYIAFGSVPFGQSREFRITDIYGTEVPANIQALEGQQFSIEFWARGANGVGEATLVRPKNGPPPANFFAGLEYHFATADEASMRNPATPAYAARNGILGADISVPGGQVNTFNAADGFLPFDVTRGTTCEYLSTEPTGAGTVDIQRCHTNLGFTSMRDYVARR